MKLQLSAILLTSTLISGSAFAADNPGTTPPSVSQNVVVTPPAPPGATVQRLTENIKIVNTAPPQSVTEVIKMSDAGVDEKTILSYVASAPPIVLKADDIIYLHEHGISSGIITAMLQHAPQIQVAQAAPAPAQAQQQQAPATAYYPAPVAQPVYTPAPQVVYTAPYPYAYPYYDYSYPYYSPSIVIGGSFGFGRPFFHSGFRHFSTFHPGFHTGFRGGFHTVSHGGFHGGFHR